jgi:uncharacterized protein (DUF885 family)
MRIRSAAISPLAVLALALSACGPDAHAPPPATAASTTASLAPASNGSSDSPDSPATLEARRKGLRAVIDEQWEYTMRTAPEYASMLGDKRFNDRWSDPSEKAVFDDLEQSKRFVARLDAIDTAGFPAQEQLDKALLARKLSLELEGAKFEGWLMPVNQFASPHLFLAQLVSLLSFASVKDYDDYVTRLRTLPAVLDGITVLMRKGLSKGLIPPKILLGKVSEQADSLAAPALEESAFAVPLKSFPASVPEADRARIRAACLAAIRDNVDPAYKRFAAFVRADYEPHGRAEPGEWALPLGQERYAFDIKTSTTVAMSADEIHELGLREVARIEAEMRKVAKKLGYPDLPSAAAGIAKNPALHFTSRKAVVDLYQKYTDQMYPKLPQLFGRLPKAKLEISPVEEFRDKGAAGAEYNPGTPDGSRPGHVMVNTSDFTKRATTVVETTAYHEGIPGHHLQVTIAQEVTGLPAFRQHYDVTSYVEGWALYAERLGEEVGFYQDPYSYFGHLQDEMLRAIRLVVDTGFHAKKWTRQQVVDFFHAHSTSDEVEVQSETDRYIAIPGQALAYKIGQLKILALREKASRALGPKFDIREFHDVILDTGALPLDVLEDQVDHWIASRRAG